MTRDTNLPTAALLQFPARERREHAPATQAPLHAAIVALTSSREERQQRESDRQLRQALLGMKGVRPRDKTPAV